MDPRCFNRSQRIALYVLADGRCASCGKPLKRGWNADHIIPFSRAGRTEIANGRSTCPACNQKKGNQMENSASRKFQQRCLQAAQAKAALVALKRQQGQEPSQDEKTCVFNLFPGSGKTRGAL